MRKTHPWAQLVSGRSRARSGVRAIWCGVQQCILAIGGSLGHVTPGPPSTAAQRHARVHHIPRTLGSGCAHSCPSAAPPHARAAGSVVVCEWQVAEQDTAFSCRFIMIPRSPHTVLLFSPRGACGPTGAAGRAARLPLSPAQLPGSAPCSRGGASGLREHTQASSFQAVCGHVVCSCCCPGCVCGRIVIRSHRGSSGAKLHASQHQCTASFPSLLGGQQVPRLCLGVSRERRGENGGTPGLQA